MIVDDRLETVLRTQAAGPAALKTQLRQLIDIVGRAAAWTDSHDRALDRIDWLHREIGDAAAAVLIRACALRSPRLVAHLVALGPRTALAAIGAARIDDAQWLQLVPDLPIHARGALRHRRDLSPPVLALLGQLGIDDFVLSARDDLVEDNEAEQPGDSVRPDFAPAEPEPAPPGPREIPAKEGIGAIVRRIEAFRRNRDNEDKAAVPAGLDTGARQASLFAVGMIVDPPASLPPIGLIDIAIDAAGTIVAADGVDPATLVGQMPFVTASWSPAWVDRASLAAFRAHLPIVEGVLHCEGAARIAGRWRIDGAPCFGADGGQFTGYRARLRRPPPPAPDEEPESAEQTHHGADALHQLLHELRTPINAIQGFAELIQQQLLGPTPHQYRSLAASIASDAARMLAGFEDVERLVRLETGRTTIDTGEVDFAAIVTRMIAQLQPLIAPREIRMRWVVPPEPVVVATNGQEAERTLWRLLATLVAAAAPGERLSLVLDVSPASARLRLTLPQSLAMRDDEALFAPDVLRAGAGMSGGGMPGGGMLGAGFALRLCDAELRAAGGGLQRPGAAGGAVLDMTLPLAGFADLDRSAVAS
jgi:signal transduction histidine kinase